KIIERKKNKRGASSIITIPVVVHIVYKNSAQNLSDAQVLSQIDVLNEDYRKINDDTSNTPVEFKPDASDSEIEFCLAVRDPNGNPTSGITRTLTGHGPFRQNDEMKFDASGGKNAWPCDQYLNIWICDLGKKLLGYATFPGSPCNVDGVVNHYKYFGNGGSAYAPYDKGRTAVHEVGHYLDLYHTFQDGCSGTTSSTCLDEGDYICDTPPVWSYTYGCPGTKNTCTETPVDQNDQTMNFMDYVDDACMNMFTTGQKDRMRAAIDGPRASLKTSIACEPFTDNDAGITDISSPDVLTCNDTVRPILTLKNFGLNNLTSANIKWRFDGGAFNIFNWSGNLVTEDSIEVSLPFSILSYGSHAITVFSTGPNGVTDEKLSNDTSSLSFTITNGDPLPFLEDWQEPVSGMPEWVIVNPNNDKTWTKTFLGVGSDGATTAYAYISHYYYTGSGQIDGLVSKPIDLSDAINPVLNFDVAYARRSDTESERLRILISTDCNTFSNEIYNKSGKDADGNTLPTVGSDQADFWRPLSASHWRNETIDLSEFSGNSIKIKFESTNGHGNGLYIDNIHIYDDNAFTLRTGKTDANCTGSSDGTAVVTAVGGVRPYTYSWSSGGGDSMETGLFAGTYSLTITDANNVSIGTSITINDGVDILSAQAGLWSSVDTWSGGILPSENTCIVIDVAHAIDMDANPGSCMSVVINGSLTNFSIFDVSNSILGTGTFTNESDASLNIGDSLGVANVILTATGNTVNFNSSNSQIVPALDYYNLTISGTSDRILPSDGVIGIAGAFTPGTNSYLITGSTFNYNNAGTQTIAAFNYNNLSSSSTGDRILPSSGTVRIAGNFSAGNNTYISSGSTIEFNGSVSQSIDGEGAVTFDNLTVNKSNGNLLINKPINIDGILSLTNGNVVTTSQNLLTLETTASILNGSSSSYISGPIAIKSNSTDSCIFHIGKNDEYRRLIITPTSVDLTTFTAEYFDSAYTNTSTLDTELQKISGVEYFQLNRTGSANANITLSWGLNSGVNADFLDELRVAHWDGVKWESVGNTFVNGDASSGSIISDVVTSFSPFTLGSTTANSPLPIELLDFTVDVKNQYVILTWSTATEINNDYFTIERSVDGINYYEIAEVEGYGYSNVLQKYTAIDEDPFQGISYYRLKQTDFDGQFEYFSPVSITFNDSEVFPINISPNPTKQNLTISFPNSKVKEVSLFNSVGVQLLNLNTMGKTVLELNVRTYAEGIYYLKFVTEQGAKIKKLYILD
ncbi:MAG: T9SS type A sorting domain-containing protein, partial [Bacteroidia bacterium]|nr:T9SS type A sorting domain-containing protein [Bacteroidia bacterium]